MAFYLGGVNNLNNDQREQFSALRDGLGGRTSGQAHILVRQNTPEGTWDLLIDEKGRAVPLPGGAHGERLDSADPATLARFMQLSRRYPSDHRIVAILSHGFAERGMVNDDQSGNVISLAGIGRALDRDSDVLLLAGCNMGTLEGVASLAPHAAYVGASPHISYAKHQLAADAARLTKNCPDPATLARELFRAPPSGHDSFVVCDSSKAKPTEEALTAFSTAILELPDDHPALGTLRASIRSAARPPTAAVWDWWGTP